MKITLTIWERVQLASIVGSGRGTTIAQVDLGLKALDTLNLSDEEKAGVEWIVVGINQFGWSQEQEYELEFDNDVWAFMRALTRTFQAWPIDERSKTLYNRVVNETT